MNNKAWIGALVLVAAVSGCATWRQPPADKLQTLPVVRFGDAVPADRDFVLFFPAGQPIPTRVLIAGNAFTTNAADTMTVALRHDLYTHKRWVSYDRTSWIPAADAFDFRFTLKVPGYDHPRPGLIEVEMNAKRSPGATGP